MRFQNYFIDAFLEEKEYGQWLSINTIRAYRTAFRHLISTCILDISDPTSLTPQNFRKFLYDLSQKNSWSYHAYNRIRKDLKVFCSFLVREKYIPANPFDEISPKKIPKELPKHFTKEQIDQIIYALHRIYPADDYISRRNKTIVYMYLYTGLRLYELVNLNINDVNRREGYIRVTNWKGGKDRLIPILEKLDFILSQYEELRDKTIENPLAYFATVFNGKLQHREIYGVLGRIKKKVTFKITTHMFRHTFATELAKKNLNLYNISQILGHSNMNTTKIYLNFSVDAIRTHIDTLDLYA